MVNSSTTSRIGLSIEVLVQLSLQRQVGELIHHLKDMVVDRGAWNADHIGLPDVDSKGELFASPSKQLMSHLRAKRLRSRISCIVPCS